ncbi:hypothetical protein GCM10007320_33280 [Pseudorhodoferax aquiterrae]|uniref:Uncharacterized protein n=1 Tax=Pseudorhodoferax aquiterrae TaxID=747304 RepID=A0ABQ3G3K9_9BURK|nr:hypothetical protein GCM10007320_33280 [Pseudorhodoferax aquiterrae]
MPRAKNIAIPGVRNECAVSIGSNIGVATVKAPVTMLNHASALEDLLSGVLILECPTFDMGGV